MNTPNLKPLFEMIEQIVADHDAHHPAEFIEIRDSLAMMVCTTMAVAGQLQLMKVGSHIAVRAPQTNIAQAEAQRWIDLAVMERLLNTNPMEHFDRWVWLESPTDIYSAANLETTGQIIETHWDRDRFFARIKWADDALP